MRGNLAEWKSSVLGRLCGGHRSCETLWHSSETGLPTTLFCTVSALDIQLFAASQGCASLLFQKNLIRTHSSWHTPQSVNIDRFLADSKTVLCEGQPSQVIHPVPSEVREKKPSRGPRLGRGHAYVGWSGKANGPHLTCLDLMVLHCNRCFVHATVLEHYTCNTCSVNVCHFLLFESPCK